MMSLLLTVEENQLVREALASRRLCTGRLMTPVEVAQATAGRDLDPSLVEGWSLCGDLAPAMFRLENLQKMSHLGRTFRGPGGVSYLVWAQQCGHWQHRFVIQLLGQGASDYLAFVRNNPIRLSLADSDGELAFLVRGPDFLRKVIPPDLPVLPIPASQLSIVEGALWVAVQMLKPETIWEPSFEAVTDVCVSVVQMPEVVAAMGLAGAPDDRPVH